MGGPKQQNKTNVIQLKMAIRIQLHFGEDSPGPLVEQEKVWSFTDHNNTCKFKHVPIPGSLYAEKSKPHGTTTVPLPGLPYSPTVGASAVSLSDTGLPAPSAIPGPDTTVEKHDTRITNLLISELHQLALHKMTETLLRAIQPHIVDITIAHDGNTVWIGACGYWHLHKLRLWPFPPKRSPGAGAAPSVPPGTMGGPKQQNKTNVIQLKMAIRIQLHFGQDSPGPLVKQEKVWSFTDHNNTCKFKPVPIPGSLYAEKSKPHGTTTVPLPGLPYSPTVGASAVSLSDTGLPAPSAIPGPDTTVEKHDTRITNLLISELHQLALHKMTENLLRAIQPHIVDVTIAHDGDTVWIGAWGYWHLHKLRLWPFPPKRSPGAGAAPSVPPGTMGGPK